ncbi:MAG: SDR family NAD(P)-dependent oxidoreductase [Gammaproteobacteria bacterium]|nr:SDR family NAD(P)-dependent oxidoreductase [Gammaproteobacteria bacterium]
MGRLADKIAVVVGAGQTPGENLGNGRATALRFAEEGAQVLLVDRNAASAEETLSLIRERGGDGSVFEADITREEDCRALVAACVERYGRLDILHNNVGIGSGDRGAASMTVEVWDRIFDTNVKGVMLVCKHALPVMRGQGHGVITNISSVAAVCAVGIVAYKSSKAALDATIHSLATGNARHGIRANVIMPGLMNTPMAIEGYVAAGRDRDELVSARDAQVPLGGKMGTAWDVANAALFLASDEARFITGAVLPVDGGQSAMVG